MPRLLRRALAIAAILSVMLSTLGAAHASCDGMRDVAGAAESGDMAAMPGMTGMHGMPSHDTTAPSTCTHGPESPADGGSGAPPCMLVAHCGSMMVVGDANVALAAETIVAERAPAVVASPHDRALEPDSPPPRG